MRNVHMYAQNLKKSLATLIAFVFFGFSAQANDVLVVGQIAEPKALDPAAVTAVNDFRILMNIYDGLVRYKDGTCLLYTSPSPRDATLSRMPSSA